MFPTHTWVTLMEMLSSCKVSHAGYMVPVSTAGAKTLEHLYAFNSHPVLPIMIGEPSFLLHLQHVSFGLTWDCYLRL